MPTTYSFDKTNVPEILNGYTYTVDALDGWTEEDAKQYVRTHLFNSGVYNMPALEKHSCRYGSSPNDYLIPEDK
jgi:hypothetical protein